MPFCTYNECQTIRAICENFYNKDNNSGTTIAAMYFHLLVNAHMWTKPDEQPFIVRNTRRNSNYIVSPSIDNRVSQLFTTGLGSFRRQTIDR
jgi:hypothetical protein